MSSERVIEAPKGKVTATVAQGEPPEGFYTHIKIHGGDMSFMDAVHALEEDEEMVERFATKVIKDCLDAMYETIEKVFGPVHIVLLDRNWWEARRFAYNVRGSENWSAASNFGVGVHIHREDRHLLRFYLVADFNTPNLDHDIETIHVQEDGTYSVVEGGGKWLK